MSDQKTPLPLVGVEREDVARKKLNFLIEEICDCEGREGMSDHDFAKQIIALAQRTREELSETDALLPKHTGQPQEGITEGAVEACAARLFGSEWDTKTNRTIARRALEAAEPYRQRAGGEPQSAIEAELREAGRREIAAWTERDQYMQSNVRLLALVRSLREAMQEACDLFAERKHDNPARSPGHNARLCLEHALNSPAAPQAGCAKGLALLKEVTGYAKANADAAHTRNDQDTWRAFERNLRRVHEALSASPPPPVAEREWQLSEAWLTGALAGLDERLDRLLLKAGTDERFILSKDSARNIVEIVREWLRNRLPAPPLLAEQGEKSP